MKLLFRDEKYVAENVAILGDLVRDANLTGTDQVNRQNVRSAQAIVQSEIDPLKQLKWAHAIPGKGKARM